MYPLFLSSLSSSLLFSVPLLLAVVGWWAGRATTKPSPSLMSWLSGALIMSLILGVATSVLSNQGANETLLISETPLSLVMLSLVVFMGVILIKFSRHYMAGEAQLGLYWRWMLLTLAAVSFVVISNHLMLFWVGWVSISLALHKLLTFYPNRPRAALAAHKKFLLARTAETLLLISIVLLYVQHGTFYISDLLEHFNRVAVNDALQLTQNEQIAALLIALTALIKCAQLPVHGWLIQVVEAPTPVSALLHAGVINLGGFLLILFGPLFLQVAIAQWLVLVVAGFTTVIAALIMALRISIKVRLAWSTSAQMGLMLVECALGLFELALLHLVTHSVYKAHAFLNSGNAIQNDIQRRLAPAHAASISDWFTAAITASMLIIATHYVLDHQGVWSVWVLMGAALTTLIAQRHSLNLQARILPFIGLAILLLLSYGSLKWLLGAILPVNEVLREEAFSWADIWVMLLIASLFLMNGLLQHQLHRPSVQRLNIALFAGLYLDEALTRLTLKIWPVSLPVRANAKSLDSSINQTDSTL